MMGNATSAAWSASPVDECLDKLGTCEALVSECETRNLILEGQIALLRHPEVIIGLACGVAVLLLLSLLRCLWHMRAGAVQGAFPWDLFPGWLLRRVWRGIRWPWIQVSSRLFGPQLAEGVAGVMDAGRLYCGRIRPHSAAAAPVCCDHLLQRRFQAVAAAAGGLAEEQRGTALHASQEAA